MSALALCFVALLVTFWAGRRSLGAGLVALLAVGYFYGILRANLITTYSHFIFDAALIGLYFSQKWFSGTASELKRQEPIRLWVITMIGWCLALMLLPFQSFLVSLVGFRGNVFFLPVLLLGARLKDRDLQQLVGGLAVLNIVALGFAGAEYFLGVPRFFPHSSVTEIMYSSVDVAGGFLRIPASFISAHAYGGTMVVSLPYLIGGWDQVRNNRFKFLALCGIGAALMGILMSATRQNFVVGSVMVLIAIWTRRGKSFKNLLVLVALLGVIGWSAATNERFQRFKSLQDTEGVADRIAGSVNRGFFEILTEYPMGNGLGGGGSSMPYFLQGAVKNPIGMENEYARVLSEQGIIGLLIWLGFVAYVLSRGPKALAKGPWATTRRMAWSLAAFSLATAFIGTGFLTSIPQTAIQLLGMGWTSAWQGSETPVPVAAPLRRYRPGAAVGARGWSA
jgi:hypothetical protein